jgi:hypothetical protein
LRIRRDEGIFPNRCSKSRAVDNELKLVKEVIVTTVELAEVHGRDFSELVQALLDQWLSTEGRYDEAS